MFDDKHQNKEIWFWFILAPKCHQKVNGYFII